MEVRVLTSTTDNEGAKVYGLVATLQMHLQYESNSAIENSISEDLKQLYNEDHATIKARKKRKRCNNSGDEKKSDKDDKKHGDNGVQNGNDKEDGDKDVQSLDSDDDNDSAGQQSTSEEEEDENAREEDEEEDLSIFEV